MHDSHHGYKKMLVIASIGVLAAAVGIAAWLFGQMTSPAAPPPDQSVNTEATDMSAPPAAAEVQVEITAAGFVPAEITITPGTQVVWLNTTNSPQSITPRGDTPPESFGNTETAAQESYVFTFDTAGVYPYTSGSNPAIQGTVHVKPAD